MEKEESIQVSHSTKGKGIEDRHQIKQADKVIKDIGERHEKIFSFRNLKEEGDREEEGQDDEAAQHETLHTAEPLLAGIVRDGITGIHVA